MLPRLPRPLPLLAFALAGVFSFSARAMSVQPPTFPELVAEASVAVRARVDHVESRFVTGSDGQRALKTFVTFSTLKTLKGKPSAQFTLEFLGGEKDGERWSVPGMPQFAVGDEEFVFPTAGASLCPLVGAMHGRYRVLTDPSSHRRYVARDNLEPLTRLEDVARPIDADTLRTATDVTRALTPDAFESAVADQVKRRVPPTPAR